LLNEPAGRHCRGFTEPMYNNSSSLQELGAFFQGVRAFSQACDNLWGVRGFGFGFRRGFLSCSAAVLAGVAGQPGRVAPEHVLAELADSINSYNSPEKTAKKPIGFKRDKK
jgi:hypothetical protein